MSRSAVRWTLIAVLALGAGGGAAVAIGAVTGGTSTTLGNATLKVTSAVYDPSNSRVFVQSADAPGQRSLEVPAGGGVITRWSSNLFRVQAGGGSFALNVVRPAGEGEFSVVAVDSHTVPADATTNIVTFPVRIPVSGGERLAIATDAPVWQGSDYPYTGAKVAVVTTPPASVGQTITRAYDWDGVLIAVEAVVEPDADRDQFGDVTQDVCPADASRQATPCTADAGVGLAATPTSIPLNGIGALAATVTAVSGAPAGTTLTMNLPPELELVQAIGPSGPCSGTTAVTCPVGDLAPGASANAVLVVRGVKAGAVASSASVATATTDPVAGNNTASANLTVTAVTAVTAGAAVAAPGCVVPPLKGLTRSAAGKLLRTFGCATGKVTTRKKPRSRKAARVVSFTPRAGTRRDRGAKVSLVLARPKR